MGTENPASCERAKTFTDFLCETNGEIDEIMKLRRRRLAAHVLAVLAAECDGPGEPQKRAEDLKRELEGVLKNEQQALQALEGYTSLPNDKDKREAFEQKIVDLLEKDALAAAIAKAAGWPLDLPLNLDQTTSEAQPANSRPSGGNDCIKKAERACLVGLAFSGGGIRSATFNLGVLQGLAKSCLLGRFDYLSTVSGGGYIGSWLVAWIKRAGFGEVTKQLHPDWQEHGGREPAEIQFLRDYSNYLTPRLGFLSADTWAAIAIYCRNLLLNLIILVSGLAAILLVPYLLAGAFHHLTGTKTLITTLALLALSFIVFSVQIGKVWDGAAQSRAPFGQARIVGGILGPLFIGMYLLCSWLSGCQWGSKKIGDLGQLLLSPSHHFTVGWAVLLFYLLLLVWAGVGFRNDSAKAPWPGVFGLALLSFFLLSFPASFWAVRALAHRLTGSCALPFHVLAFGVPLYLLITLVAGAVQVGLTGLIFRNYMREWTARLGAWVLISTAVWTVWFGIALYSPLVVMWASTWIVSGVSLAALIHIISGALAAWSAKGGKKGATNWRDVLARTAPPVFVLAFLVLLSFGIYKLLPGWNISARKAANAVHLSIAGETNGAKGAASVQAVGKKAKTWNELAAPYWCSLANKVAHRIGGWRLPTVLVVFVLALVLAILLSLRVDINDFSMHLFYRNRLVRCYLGASRAPGGTNNSCERKPDFFTGFDPKDDLLLRMLRHDAEKNPTCDKVYSGPYPILNAALNLTYGEELAWQERKAESFVFTPLFCGGTLTRGEAYRPTNDYSYPGGGPYLGTAMAISGAAVSPNMGYHSSSAVAFMLAVFNIRLGQWLRNPKDKHWDQPGPRFGLYYLLAELLGYANDRRAYVYLSDGGHFENLGIYELVRRGCRLILACDASADPEYQFEDLGNAVRKCRDDFGVEIELNTEGIGLRKKKEFSKSYGAVGIIRYDQQKEGDKPGILIYLKASLTGNEPADVLEYKRTHPDFPHDSTADQWFSESQFESYRRLGQYIIESSGVADVLDTLLQVDSWLHKQSKKELADYLGQKVPALYNPPIV